MNSESQRSRARQHCVEMNTTHGKSDTRLYRIYCGIKQRCKNSNSKDFHNYGARGIELCMEWDDSFENFFAWAMNNGYKDKLSIDRIDNNGNYCPTNCRWATVKKQARNRRTNHNVTINGVTRTAIEWAETNGIKKQTILSRLRRGWSGEEILSAPRGAKR